MTPAEAPPRLMPVVVPEPDEVSAVTILLVTRIFAAVTAGTILMPTGAKAPVPE